MSNDFLSVMNVIFSYSKWFGIPVYGGKVAVYWAIGLSLMLIELEVGAIWKLVRAMVGIAVNTSGGRSVVGRLSGSIFYANGLLSLMLTWKFIGSWNKIVIKWVKAERQSGLELISDRGIKRRVCFVTMFIGICACVEHSLSMMSATSFDCPANECFQRYILSSHGFLLQPYEYSLWLAIPTFILSIVATILWNFQDMLIILISMGLTSRYYRLNLSVCKLIKWEKKNKRERMRLGAGFYMEFRLWRKLKEAYVAQAALVRFLDNKLGPLVLLSTMNNLYFICLQLYLGIRRVDGVLINRLYYFVSLGWLLLRACSVVLAASDVTLHSQHALPHLHNYTGSAYNSEIKRLKNQLSFDSVGLSGMGLFYLNRKILLEVVAVIIKYELILLQFDE